MECQNFGAENKLITAVICFTKVRAPAGLEHGVL